MLGNSGSTGCSTMGTTPQATPVLHLVASRYALCLFLYIAIAKCSFRFHSHFVRQLPPCTLLPKASSQSSPVLRLRRLAALPVVRSNTCLQKTELFSFLSMPIIRSAPLHPPIPLLLHSIYQSPLVPTNLSLHSPCRVPPRL